MFADAEIDADIVSSEDFAKAERGQTFISLEEPDIKILHSFSVYGGALGSSNSIFGSECGGGGCGSSCSSSNCSSNCSSTPATNCSGGGTPPRCVVIQS